MLNSVLSEILKVFVLDIVVVLSLFVIVYFLIVIANLIRNGKHHRITKDSIMTYSFDLYMGSIRQNCDQLIKWVLIFFCIHLVFTFFDAIISWVQLQITYEKVPLLAIVIDIIKPIFQVIKPFVVPVVIVIALFLIIYALTKTGQQVARKNKDNDKMLSAVKDIVIQNNENVEKNLSQTADNDTKKQAKMSFGQEASYFAENIQHGFLAIIKILPKLFIVLAICIGLNSAFLSINNITKIADNYKKIDELNLAVKNLSNTEAFTRISLIKEDAIQGQAPLKTYKIDILGQDGDIISTQNVLLRGNEIAVDSININFDYSKISKGEKYNIAYPYRVYSETMAPNFAKPLKCFYNNDGLPVIYCLEQKNIYGLKEDVFYNRLSEIFDIIKDENLSREMGIRSTVGNALHFVMHENDVIDIFIEGTGGISARPHKTLYEKGENK